MTNQSNTTRYSARKTGSIFSITAADAPANGTASIDSASGSWSYTPTPDFFGTDSFVVTITDDLNGTTRQVITIRVKYLPFIVSPDTTSTGLEGSQAIAPAAITISSAALMTSAFYDQAYEFNDSVFDVITSKARDAYYNAPIEISEGLSDVTSLHIAFNLQKERQALNLQDVTAGGGTIANNAPVNFDRTINGVYFNSSGGNDILTGSDFNDFIRAGSGDDIINAGDGDDLVRGGSGSDRITLGAGRDIVYYTIDQLDGSTDTITDFNSAEDEIRWGDGIQIASRTSDQLVLQFNQDGIMRQTTILFAATQPF